MDVQRITDLLIEDLRSLHFGPPVTHVYNPLQYARASYDRYFSRYGQPPKEVVFLGMNPGPWGMTQTGVPFGEVTAVRGWLGIEEPVGHPSHEHPKRRVLGFQCRRREVSGRRLWGWARSHFGSPERFFHRFFIANYCPLLFLEESGRNRTPDRLPRAEREPLFAACDDALRRLVEYLDAKFVVGIGRFAHGRARAALHGGNVSVGCVTHPSPANPASNRGWEPLIDEELKALGVAV